MEYFWGRTLGHLRPGSLTPLRNEQAFGGTGDGDERWPALPLDGGLSLKGRIDRLDVAPDGAAAVIDYKRSATTLNLADALDGRQLQLLTYLAAAEANGHDPAGGFFVQLKRTIETVADPTLHEDKPLDPKPRGIVGAGDVPRFDPSLEGGETSAVLNVKVNQNGGFAAMSDAAKDSELMQVLTATKRVAADLGERAAGGDVRPFPFRKGTTSACGSCGLKDVCRHEPGLNGYRDVGGNGSGGDGEDGE